MNVNFSKFGVRELKFIRGRKKKPNCSIQAIKQIREAATDHLALNERHFKMHNFHF